MPNVPWIRSFLISNLQSSKRVETMGHFTLPKSKIQLIQLKGNGNKNILCSFERAFEIVKKLVTAFSYLV